jgi:thioredoxin reductase
MNILKLMGILFFMTFLKLLEQFSLAEDGGIRVDDKMRTSENDVYAAGDVCTASWEPAQHWLQVPV